MAEIEEPRSVPAAACFLSGTRAVASVHELFHLSTGPGIPTFLPPFYCLFVSLHYSSASMFSSHLSIDSFHTAHLECVYHVCTAAFIVDEFICDNQDESYQSMRSKAYLDTDCLFFW